MNLHIKNSVRRLKGIASLTFNVVQLVASLIAIFGASIIAAVISWFSHQEYLIAPFIAFALGIVLTLILGAFFYTGSNAP